MNGAAGGTAGVQRPDQLAGAEDQHVLVVDRRPSPHRRRDRDLDTVVLVAQHPTVRPGGKRKHRMLHGPEISLRRHPTEVAQKEIGHRRFGAHRWPAWIVLSRAIACPVRGFGDASLTATSPPVHHHPAPSEKRSWLRSQTIVGSESIRSWFQSCVKRRCTGITASVQTLAKPRLRRNRFNNHKLTRQPCSQRHSAARRSPTKVQKLPRKAVARDGYPFMSRES